MGMAAVGIGGVEKAQAVVVAVLQQPGEPTEAKCCLIGVVPGTHRTGSHRQARGLNSRAPKRHGVCGLDSLSGRLCRQARSQYLGSKPCGSRSTRYLAKELAAVKTRHGDLLGQCGCIHFTQTGGKCIRKRQRGTVTWISTVSSRAERARDLLCTRDL